MFQINSNYNNKFWVDRVDQLMIQTEISTILKNILNHFDITGNSKAWILNYAKLRNVSLKYINGVIH